MKRISKNTCQRYRSRTLWVVGLCSLLILPSFIVVLASTDHAIATGFRSFIDIRTSVTMAKLGGPFHLENVPKSNFPPNIHAVIPSALDFFHLLLVKGGDGTSVAVQSLTREGSVFALMWVTRYNLIRREIKVFGKGVGQDADATFHPNIVSWCLTYIRSFNERREMFRRIEGNNTGGVSHHIGPQLLSRGPDHNHNGTKEGYGLNKPKAGTSNSDAITNSFSRCLLLCMALVPGGFVLALCGGFIYDNRPIWGAALVTGGFLLLAFGYFNLARDALPATWRWPV